MLTAHRIALDPNNRQATHFAKAAGTARFAYNWALAEWGRQYEAWKQDNTRPRPASLRLAAPSGGHWTPGTRAGARPPALANDAHAGRQAPQVGRGKSLRRMAVEPRSPSNFYLNTFLHPLLNWA